MRDFEDDLLEWKWLYAAGRLHKPVVNVWMISYSFFLNILVEFLNF